MMATSVLPPEVLLGVVVVAPWLPGVLVALALPEPGAVVADPPELEEVAVGEPPGGVEPGVVGVDCTLPLLFTVMVCGLTAASPSGSVAQR